MTVKRTPEELKTVTRVEIIDKTGRAYVNLDCKRVEVSMQDDNRTMKVFIK